MSSKLMDHYHLSGETYHSSESTYFQIPVASSFRVWAELLPEVVDMILKRLHEFSDYLHFCCVCSRWRSVALQDTSNHRQNLDLLKASCGKLPMLLFKTEENNYDERSLYNVSDGKTYKLQLPLPCRKRFVGSFHGWLICCEEDEVITLSNPLTKGFILLPNFRHSDYVNWSLMFNGEYFLEKVILTADPHVRPDDYVVVVIFGECSELAVYRSGDPNWKFIDLCKLLVYHDIVCHHNNIYGLTFMGEIILVDHDTGTGELIVNEPWEKGAYKLCYLVESLGELLLVQRSLCLKNNLEMPFGDAIIYEDEDEDEDELEDEGDKLSNDHSFDTYRSSTTDFTVFKLVREKGNSKLVQVNNIGEQALFLGGNHSVSISTLECPEFQPNSIYFTNEYYLHKQPYICGGLDEDSGIFNMKDKSFQFHHRLDMCDWYMNLPIWFVPNFAIKA